MKPQMDSRLGPDLGGTRQTAHERNDMKKVKKGVARKGWWSRFIDRVAEANKDAAASGCSR